MVGNAGEEENGVLESSGGLAGPRMDNQAGGSMLAGTGPSFQWARALRSASAISVVVGARVSGETTGRSWEGRKMTEEVGSVAAERPLMLQ